jgi:lipoate---protein ligase
VPEQWKVEWRRDAAEALHHAPVPEPAVATVWVCEPIRPALVLGSTQRDVVVPERWLADQGIDLVRRRSGGGAVLVIPGHTTWVDLVLPAGHELWDDDVGRATHWVGDLWVRALTSAGMRTTTHRGAMQRTEWSGLVCFAGLGPGEVIDAHGHKLVGISQRRTRHAARFQTVAYHGADPAEIVRLLGLEPERATTLTAVLRDGVRALSLAPSVVIDALFASLPR